MAQNEQRKKVAEEAISELEAQWNAERKWKEWPTKEEKPE